MGKQGLSDPARLSPRSYQQQGITWVASSLQREEKNQEVINRRAFEISPMMSSNANENIILALTDEHSGLARHVCLVHTGGKPNWAALDR